MPHTELFVRHRIKML